MSLETFSSGKGPTEEFVSLLGPDLEGFDEAIKVIPETIEEITKISGATIDSAHEVLGPLAGTSGELYDDTLDIAGPLVLPTGPLMDEVGDFFLHW